MNEKINLKVNKLDMHQNGERSTTILSEKARCRTTCKGNTISIKILKTK